MPMYDNTRNGKKFFQSANVERTKNHFRNGVNRIVRADISPDNYGGRFRAVLPKPIEMPSREAQKLAFNVEAPARDTSLKAYKEEKMRGRAKGAYNVVSGKSGRRMTLTAPASGVPAGQDLQGLGMMVTVPEGEATIGQALNTGMGQTEAEISLWKRDLDEVTEDIKSFNMFTATSKEQRVYNKVTALVSQGKAIFANNPTILQAPLAIESEQTRWAQDRPLTLFGQGADDKSLSKIRERMLNVVNQARTIVGLSATSTMPYIPEYSQLNIPEIKEQLAPGSPTPATSPQAEIKQIASQGTWFQRNKILVIGGIALGTVLAGFAWLKRR